MAAVLVVQLNSKVLALLIKVTSTDDTVTVQQSGDPSSCTSQSAIPVKKNRPFHGYSFPKRYFGKNQRSFLLEWFKKYPWLHYNEATDSAFCFNCMTTATGGKIHSAKQDDAFISCGFTNWKNATTAFKKHEDSKCHKEMITASLLPQQCGDISEIMSSELAKEKQKNQEMLLVILRAVRFLARQGLAFRGHEQAEGNLIQLLQMQSETNHDITIWLQRKQDKYLAPECQNEILHLMAHSILRKIITTIHENIYFTN